MEPTARSVLPEMAKLASTRWRKGSKLAVSDPAAPSQRSWLRLRLNPGSRSLRNELVTEDRKSTRLNSSHANISYAVFCLKKNIVDTNHTTPPHLPHHLFFLS